MSANPVTRYLAELVGTCILVLVGCGSAVLAGGDIGFVGISLAFGSALMLLVYCIGPISGCHVNPAVTLCLAFSRKFPFSNVLGYIIAQCLGAILGAFVIYLIATGKVGTDIHQSFAVDGFGEYSPRGYSMLSCFICETALTTLLLFVVLSTTHSSFPGQFSGLVLGFTLLAIHLVSIPVTNTSVNFARSLGVAVFHGGWALDQLWLFAAAQVIAVFIAMGLHCISCCKN